MKRIVLCLDGSLESKKAGRFLARLVHEEPYELIVLSILAKPAPPPEIAAHFERQRALLKDAYAEIEQFFAGANVKIRQLIRFGRPGKKIVSVAQALDADLIVLGAVGQSMVARILLGSTSDYVATHAHCSVVVVRTPNEKIDFENTRMLSVGLAYEQSGPARAALEEISEFQWGTGAQFNLLTVVPDQIDFTEEAALSRRVKRTQTQISIDKLRDELREIAPINLGFLLDGNHVGEAIVNFAESHTVDLLVIGETKRSRTNRFLLGSVSRFVLRHAPCSVWITRNRPITGIEKPARGDGQVVRT